jgi:hypothetical protein
VARACLRLLLALGFICFPFVVETSACSSLDRTSREIFEDSVAVFRGMVTRAEVMTPPTTEKRAVYRGMVIVKVHWKTDEIYKGADLADKSAITTNFCGGVSIVVGDTYIFTIVEIDKSALPVFEGVGEDVIGFLDPDATKSEHSVQSTPYEYRRLVDEFRALRDGK